MTRSRVSIALIVLRALDPRPPQLPQLGQDDQAAVGPPPTLDAQRPEIRRGGRIAQSLRVVQQPPAVDGQVDAGFGVLDDGPVHHVPADLEATLVFDLHDVVQRALADDGVGADPEGGPVVAHPLMDDVLQVGGGAGQALHPGGRTGERGVRGLDDGQLGVLRLGHHVHQPQAVLRQDDAVRVQGQQVVGVRNDDRAGVPGRRQDLPLRRLP